MALSCRGTLCSTAAKHRAQQTEACLHKCRPVVLAASRWPSQKPQPCLHDRYQRQRQRQCQHRRYQLQAARADQPLDELPSQRIIDVEPETSQPSTSGRSDDADTSRSSRSFFNRLVSPVLELCQAVLQWLVKLLGPRQSFLRWVQATGMTVCAYNV